MIPFQKIRGPNGPPLGSAPPPNNTEPNQHCWKDPKQSGGIGNKGGGGLSAEGVPQGPDGGWGGSKVTTRDNTASGERSWRGEFRPPPLTQGSSGPQHSDPAAMVAAGPPGPQSRAQSGRTCWPRPLVGTFWTTEALPERPHLPAPPTPPSWEGAWPPGRGWGQPGPPRLFPRGTGLAAPPR